MTRWPEAANCSSTWPRGGTSDLAWHRPNRVVDARPPWPSAPSLREAQPRRSAEEKSCRALGPAGEPLPRATEARRDQRVPSRGNTGRDACGPLRGCTELMGHRGDGPNPAGGNITRGSLWAREELHVEAQHRCREAGSTEVKPTLHISRPRYGPAYRGAGQLPKADRPRYLSRTIERCPHPPELASRP